MTENAEKTDCPNCGRPIARYLRQCPYCQVPTSTRTAPTSRPGRHRWDAWQFVAAGIVLAIAGGVVSLMFGGVDDGFGTFVLTVTSAVASAWVLVGVIAKGVDIGIRASRESR
jgi:hypothetical protein